MKALLKLEEVPGHDFDFTSLTNKCPQIYWQIYSRSFRAPRLLSCFLVIKITYTSQIVVPGIKHEGASGVLVVLHIYNLSVLP